MKEGLSTSVEVLKSRNRDCVSIEGPVREGGLEV